MSAISRAFTTRRVKQSIDVAAANKAKDDLPKRSKTTKATTGSMRTQISAPVELIHTTNMLSYNAPDISRANSTAHSIKSSDEESDSTNTVTSSPPTSPDVDPREDDDLKTEGSGPAPNHLSCYFIAPSQAKDFAAPAVSPPPAIPKRAPSHTKKASYDAIARSRSVSTMSKESDRTVSTKNSMTFSSRASSSSTAASTISHNSIPAAPKPPVPAVPPVAFQQFQHAVPAKAESQSHPFGRELAQVSEIAEDFGIKHKVLDAEELALKKQGLHKFSADAYASEIQDLFSSFMTDAPTTPRSNRQQHRPRPDAALWI